MTKSIKYILLIFCFYVKAYGQINLDSGLIGYYNFSSNGFDSSGFNNHATVSGDSYVEDRFGHPCSALRLKGNGEYVEFPKIVSLEFPEWTYSIWFKLEKLPSTADDAFLLTYKNINYDDDVHLYVDNDDDNIKLWSAVTGNKESSGVQVIKDVWHHVVLVSTNGNQLKMYVNGQIKMSLFVDYISTGSAILISSNYSGSTIKGRVNGVIDAVRFYNRPLSSPEASALYQFVEGDTALCVPTPTQLNSEIKVPNAFSPNNDGRNDNFCLQGWASWTKTFNIIIYDRWGENVYESNDANFSWDGYYKNKPLDAAVFVYYIKAVSNSGEPILRKGNISLIK